MTSGERHGVTVNSVLAGPTASPAISTRAWRNNKTFRKPKWKSNSSETIRPTSLLKRFESTEEVASVVAFATSTQDVAINGAGVHAERGVIRSNF